MDAEEATDTSEIRAARLWMWGVEGGWIISGFNHRRPWAVAQTVHRGEDVRTLPGQMIFAMDRAEVIRVRDFGSVGGYHQEITLFYPSVQRYVLYGHVQRGVSQFRRPGQVLQAGDLIAFAGTSADALHDYPHVHVQVWSSRAAADRYDNAAAIDPAPVRRALRAAVSGQVGPSGPCAYGDGFYCGGNTIGGDPSDLFECENGVPTRIRTCANGCKAMPGGLEDRCIPDLCPFGDGLYCGDGVYGNDFTLYRCEEGERSIAQVCSRSSAFAPCVSQPPGVPDSCAPAACPMGDGLYCGGNMIGGNQRNLYSCRGGQISLAERCARRCEPMPAGSPDRCL
jgi:hypothetical protein